MVVSFPRLVGQLVVAILVPNSRIAERIPTNQPAWYYLLATLIAVGIVVIAVMAAVTAPLIWFI